ncbi:hypothetical protein A3K80_09220 [Candidatus Bathyarchaeota archaeon RBG_13_38_9]|nr:MAG: hypothetical protein A3K80_09220 [Candidatus Bathyarchaeota archaeon RBG_13_38_9]
MILSFKQKFPWGKLTNFVDKILKGIKIHTMREDKHHRWKPGRKIHMATGVRTKFYNCFYNAVCKSTQTIEIRHIGVGTCFRSVKIWIDNEFRFTREFVNYGETGFLDYPSTDFLELLAKNDGFDSSDDFLRWFNKDLPEAVIIHWTDFKY